MPVYTDKKSNRKYIKFDYEGATYKKRLPKEITDTDAKKIETKWKHQLFFEANGIEAKKQITFNDFLAEHFLDFAESHYSADGFKNNVKVICVSASKYFGKVNLRKITVSDIDRFVAFRTNLLTMHETKRKPATVIRELNIISKVFNYAIANNFCEVNPCSRCEKPVVDNIQDKVLSREQVDKFLNAFKSNWARDVSVFILNTGLRQKDVLGLKKFDVDFKEERIRLTQTKTGKSVFIPLNKLSLAILEKRRSNGSELFFPSPKTGQQGTMVKGALRGACDRAGFEKVGTRVLRRTFATMLTELNYQSSTIAKLLGHSDMRSIHRYQRETDILREAVKALEPKGKIIALNNVARSKGQKKKRSKAR